MEQNLEFKTRPLPFKKKIIEGLLLYRILWFSVIHQKESAIGTSMSPPMGPPSYLPPHPTLQYVKVRPLPF